MLSAAHSSKDDEATLIPVQYVTSAHLRLWFVHIFVGFRHRVRRSTDGPRPMVLGVVDSVNVPSEASVADLRDIRTAVSNVSTLSIADIEDVSTIFDITHSDAAETTNDLVRTAMGPNADSDRLLPAVVTHLARILPALLAFVPLVVPLSHPRTIDGSSLSVDANVSLPAGGCVLAVTALRELLGCGVRDISTGRGMALDTKAVNDSVWVSTSERTSGDCLHFPYGLSSDLVTFHISLDNQQLAEHERARHRAQQLESRSAIL